MSEVNGIGNSGGPSSGSEPSMEEILASIRRILTEEESERGVAPSAAAAESPAEELDDDILVLDSTAMVPTAPAEPPEQPAQLNGAFHSEPTLDSQASAAPEPEPAGEAQYIPASVVQPQQNLSTLNEKEFYMDDQVHSPEGLVGDKVANEIASTVGSLVRSVSAERAVQIGRPGVTIEDLVREEVKPVLKAWLDSHLPSLVERVVRAEIGRVIDRM
jgi:cell pole-organizing protein PopZ